MNYELTVEILEKIHRAKDLWIMSEGGKESMYEILNEMDVMLSKYSVDAGFIGKMSKSDGEA